MGALVETGTGLSAKGGLAYLRSALPSADARLKGMLSLADQAVVSAANFATGVILARACAKEEFGLYMLGFSLVLVALDIQTALLATPYMIHSPRLQAGALRRYSGASFVQQLVLSGTFAAGLMVASVILRLRGTGSKPLAQVLLALGCVIVLVASREFIRRVCFAHLRMATALLFDTCVAVIQVGGLVVIAWTGHLSASRCYWVVGFACGVAVVGWLGTNHKHLDIILRDVPGAAGDNWQLGKWILVSGVVWTLTMNAYPWILNAFHGAAATAVWGACLAVTASSNPLLQGTLNYLGPKIAHSYADGGREELRRAVGKCNAIIGAVLLPICLVLVLGGGLLVQLLYGHKYAGNGIVVAVLALGMAANAVVSPYGRALFVLDRADLDFAINVAALVLSIGCGVPLVKWLGPFGAACTSTAVYMGSAVLRVLAFHAVMARQTVAQTNE
jgi:O-antigen/teichoic acid export membrane protein